MSEEIELLSALARVVGGEHVSAREVDRKIYNRDAWPRNTIRLQGLDLPESPQAVVWPGTVAQVQEIVRLAGAAGMPIIPLGAASGVCGGTVALGGRGIVLDLKRLHRILAIDEQSLTVTAEAGTIGEILERRLNRRGYTLGHFPSSIYCSSYGGWLSTRAAGQLSAKYGKIEDMVLSVQAVMPSGEVLETPLAPRPPSGPDWNQALVGAEGTLGIIVAATCRIWPYPASRLFQAFAFETVEDGLEAIRRMMQAELRPAAIRLYDPVDTFFSRAGKIMPAAEKEHPSPRQPKPRRDRGAFPRWVIPRVFRPRLLNPLLARLDRSKMVLSFEGDPDVTRLEKSQARGLCATTGGHDLGETPARHWWNHRYKVSYAMQAMFDLGLFVDTIEVATVWDNLADLYYEMRESIGRHAFVMAHFSHAYPQGCSIYFSIAATGKSLADKLAVYDRVWEAALSTCVERGGAISHHHGVGVLKAKWLAEQEGGALPLLRALKDAADPAGIMNPGKLGLGAAKELR